MYRHDCCLIRKKRSQSIMKQSRRLTSHAYRVHRKTLPLVLPRVGSSRFPKFRTISCFSLVAFDVERFICEMLKKISLYRATADDKASHFPMIPELVSKASQPCKNPVPFEILLVIHPDIALSRQYAPSNIVLRRVDGSRSPDAP